MLIAFFGCLVAEVAEVAEVDVVGITENTCPDYAPSWVNACPAGKRCIEFRNSCAEAVSLAYSVGCNSDGSAGSPQCACTPGASLAPTASAYWIIIDGDYPDSPPAWTPVCLTEGLAVLVNPGDAPSCATGTRVEFTSGNSQNKYQRFDSYNLDVEKDWYSVPVAFGPVLPNGCAVDHGAHDCRPLWCDNAACPDAYFDPTHGGCSDNRSPQVGCQDSFSAGLSYLVEYCPATGANCQDAVACPEAAP